MTKTIEVIEEEFDAEDFTMERQHKGYTLRRYDPFGFVRIIQAKSGPRPPELNGEYTDFTSASRDIDAYINKIELLKTTPLKSKAS